jgi:hypothetical protein
MFDFLCELNSFQQELLRSISSQKTRVRRVKESKSFVKLSRLAGVSEAIAKARACWRNPACPGVPWELAEGYGRRN